MNVTPRIVPLKIQKNNDYSTSFYLYDNSNNIVNLTTAAVYSSIKLGVDSSAPLIVDFNVTVALDHKVTLSLAAADTDVVSNFGFYDVLVIDDGDQTTYRKGDVVFLPTITTVPEGD